MYQTASGRLPDDGEKEKKRKKPSAIEYCERNGKEMLL
jgi:hypothetical protein